MEILSCGNVSLDLTDLRSYDDYTYAHSVNVAVYCGVIGMGMGMSEVELGHLVTAALLHDLGKLQIPDEILNKPGRLTQEEYLIMKSHATLSYQTSVSGGIFCRISRRPCCITMKMWTEADTRTGWKARSRRCLPGFCTWRMSIDALTSRRPYKEPYAPYEATEYLMGGCGIMFDREVVETLQSMCRSIRRERWLRFPMEEKPSSIKNLAGINLRPVVRLMDGELLDISNEANYHITLRMKTESGFSTEEAEKERNEMIRPHQYHLRS